MDEKQIDNIVNVNNDNNIGNNDNNKLDNKLDVVENKGKKKSIKDFFKSLPPKKLIALIVLGVFCLGAIGGGIALGVILGGATETIYIEKQEYHYAVKVGDNEGVQLDNSWMKGVAFKEFQVVLDEGFIITSEMVLKSKFSSSSFSGTAMFYYKEDLAAIYYLDACLDAIYINNLSELIAIDGATASYYIQKKDIDVSGELKISRFQGYYYGNYCEISNANLTEGAMFLDIKNSYVSSIRLTFAKSNIDSSKNQRIGMIAGNSENVKYVDCSASGDLVVNLDANEHTSIYIGGLFGYLKTYDRKSTSYDESDLSDGQTSYVKKCVSNIKIVISGKGNIYVGGIAGYSYNQIFKNCVNNGDISILASGLATIGGIAGEINKNYSVFDDKILYFDASVTLKNNGKISVISENSYTTQDICVGGIAGRLKNHNLYNNFQFGEIYVSSTGSVTVGGILGQAQNLVNSQSFSMIVSDNNANSNINIKANGHIVAAKITARTVNPIYGENNYSDCNLTVDNLDSGFEPIIGDKVAVETLN